ncbi:hypothetical protein OROMI_030962 [Orobanche minor]
MFQHGLIVGLQHLTVDISLSQKLDIFIIYGDEDGCQYFTAHSAEDGNISPAKYYIYPPFRDFFFADSSCNGLLLFQNAEWENLVWNPTTNQFNIFPKTFDKPPPGVILSYLGIGMWCDPSYGYKVLQVVEAQPEDDQEYIEAEASYHIELYSYKTNSWKIIRCDEFVDFGSNGICINGAFYSTGARKAVGDTDIISFDFSTETLSTIPLPNQTRDSDGYCFLEYKGLLGCLVYWRDSTKCRYELWVMTIDKSWTRGTVFNTCGVRKPLWFSQNGMLLYFETFDNELVVFDRATGKLKHLDICLYADYGMRLIPVLESFVPLNRMLDLKVQDKKEEKYEDVTEANDGQLVQA